MITYWSFESALIRTYTLPYLHIIKKNLPAGSRIFLVTLSPESSRRKEFDAFRDEQAADGITALNFRYRRFGPVMFFRLFGILATLIQTVIRQRINYIHGWCTPGGAIGYLVSVITRRPLVLDSFEPHAESMVETATWKKNSFAFRALFLLEKLQLKRAESVIFAAEGMAEYAVKTYGVRRERYFIKPACVDLQLFDPDNNFETLSPKFGEDEIVCVYAGKFGDLYLDVEVFEFFKVAAAFWGQRFRVLLLTGHSNVEIQAYCRASGFDPAAITRKFVPHHEIPAWLANGSFGICPMRPVPTKKFGTPIKNGEYWAMGLPVVITKDISTDSALIGQHNAGYVLQRLDQQEYRRAVEKIDQLIKEPRLKHRIRELAVQHRNFKIAEAVYSAIYG